MFARAIKFLFRGNRGAADVVGFLVVAAILFIASLWVIQFVYGRTVALAPEVAADSGTAGFTNYSILPEDGVEYIQPESLAAMAAYIAANPEPQNVQVLTGMNTSEISSFMVTHVSGGLKVDCTYCHNVENFAAEELPQRATARQHLLLTADLNQNWLPTLASLSSTKQPSGSQITCATCHLGDPLPVAWPENLAGLPDDFRLPLDNLDVLLVTGREDISLDTVQLNQHTMYHFNESLNVGCTHCHNSRYFPSNERPAKSYALYMLTMSKYINDNYADVMNQQEPSCTMCHHGAVLPPGSATSDAALPAAIARPSDDNPTADETAP